MNSRWRELSKKLDLLSRRERVVILLMSLAVVVGLGFTGLIELQMNKNAKLEGQVKQAEAQLESLRTDIKLMTFALQVGPNQQERQAIVQLEEKVAELDKSLKETAQKLLSPSEMPAVLREVISAEKKVKMISIENLPVEVLVKPEASAAKAAAKRKKALTNISAALGWRQGESIGLYRHSFELQVEGEYLDIYSFLNELNEKPWRFFWDDMEYQVSEFPLARVTFHVSTLSTQTGWIGL